jgi:hypothetical protein
MYDYLRLSVSQKKKYHKSEMHVRMSIYSGLEIQ